jgi:DNA-binding CsgD family transcriptional regulator
MKRFTCVIFLCTLFLSVYSQNKIDVSIPDFDHIKDNDNELLDTIDRWYVTKVWYPKDTIQSLPFLKAFSEYAKHSENKITKAAAKFYLGHYNASFLKKDSIGFALMHEAIAEVDNDENTKYVWICFMHDIAMAYNEDDKAAKSLEYQLRAYEGYKQLGINKYPKAIEIVVDLAHSYYHLGNYTVCKELLLPIRNIPANIYYTEHIHNTLGLVYRELNQLDSALYYFRKTVEFAEASQYYAWVGIASGNIGTVYIKQNKPDMALPYAKLFYEYSVKEINNLSNTTIAEALIELAEINMLKQNADVVIEQLKEAEKLMFSKQNYYIPNNYQLLKKIYFTLSAAYLLKKNYSEAFNYYQETKRVEDSIASRNIIDQYTKTQTQIEAEKSLHKIKLIENENKLSIQRRNFMVFGLVLIGLLLLTWNNRQRLKHRKDKELFLLEKERSEKHLATYMNNLHEKNRMIEDFQEQIRHLEDLPKLETIETLYRLQQATIITEEGWFEFKELFDRAHRGFFTRLKDRYPDLTQAEIRLLALTKLNISTKEMANMLGISPGSIRKGRYRLLKKIRHPENANLEEIIESL